MRPLVLPLLLCLAAAAGSGCSAVLRPDPPRALPLEATDNTRDLGGYETTDGHRVRWGMLYRSDAFTDLDDDDVRSLRRLGLRTVIDLRSTSERQRDGDDVLPPEIRRENIEISYPEMEPATVAARILRGGASDGYFERMLQRANLAFALDHEREMAEVVELLAQPGALPAVVHCSLGKDRTGFVSAMILEMLGVPWETIVEDFLLSNDSLSPVIARRSGVIRVASLFRISGKDARDLLGVQKSYLETARAALLEHYGSMAEYRRAIGVSDTTLARLRAALLEPADPAFLQATDTH